ncbi:MAG: decarboxylating 6-phosphogluconate dehydrogenase [Chloroflexi bacterium]|jgi:6-phosphogluconate dehydrogenase|nr:decarboxylating 6-phosphogluconate dehydrogenase [Chloroflexota bacterium]MBT5319082.1 decarboxylating 6-phosphogluconate dehydrogenase [Chloroflexota bacterium]
MQLGMIGLGRMGGNMAQRLLEAGHNVVAYDQDEGAVQSAIGHGAEGSTGPSDLVSRLSAPRAVWIMLPSGEITENVIDELLSLLSPGDTIIDGGNSNYKDSIRRSEKASDHGVDFLDAGTSGGIWGLQEGYALMVGGDKAAYERLEPIFQSLAPAADRGVGRVGPSGAGHFTKMIHNGIEYGMMQAYAEGFEILAAKSELAEDLEQISKIWQHGSVVRSWLLDLAVAALEEDGDLSALTSYVDDSGEGRWTVQESVDLGVPAPVITASLQARFRSRQANPFGGRMLAALRNQFGGHAVQKSE